MGFFDFLKGSSNANDNPANIDIASFKKDLIQEVAVYMYKTGITDAPGLKFFNNDNGLFEAHFMSTVNDPGVRQIKKAMPQMYLTVLGTHALGTAVHIATCQSKFDMPVEEFGAAEVQKLANDFAQTDAYELALKDLGIGLNSNNKKVVDGIVMTAQGAASLSAGGDISNNMNLLKAYCEVLYNAGVTVAYK